MGARRRRVTWPHRPMGARQRAPPLHTCFSRCRVRVAVSPLVSDVSTLPPPASRSPALISAMFLSKVAKAARLCGAAPLSTLSRGGTTRLLPLSGSRAPWPAPPQGRAWAWAAPCSGLIPRVPGSLSCGCGGLHTESDKAFTEFLKDEIKEEKNIQKHKALPKVAGWEIEFNGTEAKLIKKLQGETITVTFNINNSIPPNADEPAEEKKDESEEPDLVSTPNFVVEVNKSNSKLNLVFDCHYPDDEIAHGEEGDEDGDIFAIREVSFQPTAEGEWKDTSYTLNTDTLDWTLYDHMMDFLADRGVDNTFADELVELSTALEHQEYIHFLEELNGFVKCQ
ncbi:LOW QUALITY PROTEIN: complement component 1 Q subcomponent-binding protein, mitochondrial [Lethenteron reissneri]|uniref:LOW QUALITY PROTEIN: complement component 1 Q subcomponent-binding protein, mitochondrial n=1 Tax=Lethenteron reissneri TaxID=7753 RepID=UPI002AB62FBE|nr:LOW QUALITY PROTEIN: complement component 1 Q subcomponent-binding protein, mitochondrial [Lethenteron reissneri]